MQNLLALPYEIQVVLVSGYLGYKISSIGRDKSHRVEDTLLQILTFGLVARSVTILLPPQWASLPLVTLTSITSALVLSAIWRGFLSRYTIKVIQFLQIYRDDHEPTAWASLTSNRAKWTFIQIHLKDGRVLESVFANIPLEKRPSREITLNEDGIVLYVTATYSASNEKQPHPVKGSDDDFIVTFIPRSEIQQVEVGWKK